METFLEVGLGNAATACLLTIGAGSAGVFGWTRRRPALRHGLWLLVLLKLVTPPLWRVPVEPPPRGTPSRLPDTGRGEGPVDSSDLDIVLVGNAPIGWTTVAERRPTPAGMSWGRWAIAVWIGGSLLTFGVAARRIWRFHRLLARCEPGSEAIRAQVEALADRLGLKRAPEVRQVPGGVSPMLWAIGCRPRLIVSTALWERLDARQRATLLTHELAHVKRRDHWVRGLELLVTGLYWWLPSVWIARHALREAEEQCCDAWVVWAFPDAARTYAEALLETLDFLSGAMPAVAVAASGLGPVDQLKRRMTMIMQGTTPRTLTWSGLLGVLGLSATLLPLAPTWAQRVESPGETPAFAPEKPATADPGRHGRDGGDRERQPAESPRRKVQIFRFDGDESLDARTRDKIDQAMRSVMEGDLSNRQEASDSLRAMQKTLAELKAKLSEITARKGGEPLDDRTREELDRAVQQFQDAAKDQRTPAALFKKKKPPVFNYPKRETGEAGRGEGAKDREADERDEARGPKPRKPAEAVEGRAEGGLRDELKRLMAEVDERRAALEQAEIRLKKAIEGQAAGADGARLTTRNQTFEIRINKSGQDPHQKAMPRPGTMDAMPLHAPPDRDKRLTRPVGPDGRPIGALHAPPDQEKRLAEMEKRLEKLQDEVRSLKKDAPADKP